LGAVEKLNNVDRERLGCLGVPPGHKKNDIKVLCRGGGRKSLKFVLGDLRMDSWSYFLNDFVGISFCFFVVGNAFFLFGPFLV
jgi:hypothetical protein